MTNFVFSMLYYWIAYFIVTAIGILHTIFNIVVLHMKSMKDSPGMGDGYYATKPWHPWSLTFKEFYVDYQPWITLIYIAIYASPFIAYGFSLL